MITKFNEYINEALTDKMTPKGDDEIRLSIENYIKNKDYSKLYNQLVRYDLKDFFTEEEIEEIYDNVSMITMIDLAAEEDEYELIKRIVKDNYNKKSKKLEEFDMSPLHQKITSAYNIIGIAFEWNQDAVFDLIESKYGLKSNPEMMVVDALELLKDEELVDLYGVMIDKINDLSDDN